MTDGTPAPSSGAYATSGIWHDDDHADPEPIRRRIASLDADQRSEFWRRVRDVREHGVQPTSENLEQILDWLQKTLRCPQPTSASETPDSDNEPVVYYVRFGERVKIGRTSNLKQRLLGIPHDEVLALELGGALLEKQRHREFADLRITGEWFRYEAPLREHVVALLTTDG